MEGDTPFTLTSSKLRVDAAGNVCVAGSAAANTSFGSQMFQGGPSAFLPNSTLKALSSGLGTPQMLARMLWMLEISRRRPLIRFRK